jgi:O-antigen ligase
MGATKRWLVFGIAALAVVCGAMGLAVDAVNLSLPKTIAAGVAAMLLLSLALANYNWSVALSFLLLGIQIIEPSPVDFAFVIVIGVALVTARMNPRQVPLWVLLTMGTLIALNLLSSIEAVDAGRAAFFMGVTIYLCGLGLWTASYVTTPDRARLIFKCLVWVCGLSALLGSLAIFVNVPFFTAVTDGSRVNALFDDPNIYGPFLVSMSLLLLQELLDPRVVRWRRPTIAFWFTLITIGAFLSYSRAAWLNWVVGIVVFMAIMPLRRGGAGRALIMVLIVLTGVVVTAGTVVLTGQAEFVQERAQYQQYDNERFGAQELGIELAETKPIGVGPGQFERHSPVSAHSTYIRAGAEQGLIGFFVVVILFFGTLMAAARNVILGRDTAGIGSLGLLAVWCGTLANSVFIDSLHWRHLFVFAGLIWAGSLAAPAIGQASSRAGVRSPM